MRLYNLREVNRPADVEEAVRLLHRKGVNTVALGGGVELVGEGGPEIDAVVDLSRLGLEVIERKEEATHLGAMVRLQTLVDDLDGFANGLLAKAARLTATWHIRNAATIGGTLMSAGGSAPFLAALSVLNGEVTMRNPDEEIMPLDVFLAARERLKEDRALLTGVVLRNLGDDLGHGYTQIGRTPADTPIICVACQARDTGRVRMAVGGVWEKIVSCETPDDPARSAEALGEQADGAPLVNDYLGSSDYRIAMLPVLIERAIRQARSYLR